MKDLILIFSVLAMVVFGYFVVKKLDQFVMKEKKRSFSAQDRRR